MLVRKEFGKRLVPGAIAAALLALCAVPFVPRILRACGPYFPLEILSSRGNALEDKPPAVPMTYGLVPTPGETLPVDESDNDEARTSAELANLPPEQQELVKAMRALSTGDAAYAAGEGLPPMARDYTAGAVSYHHKQYDKARDYFTRVVTTPPADPAEVRVVWAHYMLGAIARLQGDAEGAAAHWTTTRGLVRSGQRDPLGLAVASLGEEGRLWLKPGTLAKAVSFYAKQAAYGSERGRASLLKVAAQTIVDPELLDEGLRDETTRRLIVRYLYSGRSLDQDVDLLETAKPLGSDEVFQRVLDAFERQRAMQVEGADLLAAQAYANGRYTLAGQLAEYDSTPLSAWIKGKLALRRGERHAALSAFADALKGLPAHQDIRRRAMAETGVLQLSGGDFAQAMELFYGAVVDASTSEREFGGRDYWADAAYLAERVLTVDELLPLVDRLAPPATPAELDEIRKDVAAQPDNPWRTESPKEQLRELTARRLMRAGRHDEALRYFDADEALHGIAKKYIDALTAAGRSWSGRGTRAQAWFTAGTIARANGMELLGFELAPDYGIEDGMFEYWPAKPAGLAGKATEGFGGSTPVERQRVEASKPVIDSRFHYRLTAVDHALASSEALPHSSQAFAAVLCRATSWIIDREPKRAGAIYARYVKEGPYVSWAGTFGRTCPAPDFASAERRRWDERVAMATWLYTDHPLRTAGGGTLLVVAAIAWFVLRKRGKQSRMSNAA
jgi:tetratricopeptide (TPR) repeat protein